jgi:hypothetical protein
MAKKKGFEAFCYITIYAVYWCSIMLPSLSGAMCREQIVMWNSSKRSTGRQTAALSWTQD